MEQTGGRRNSWSPNLAEGQEAQNTRNLRPEATAVNPKESVRAFSRQCRIGCRAKRPPSTSLVKTHLQPFSSPGSIDCLTNKGCSSSIQAVLQAPEWKLRSVGWEQASFRGLNWTHSTRLACLGPWLQDCWEACGSFVLKGISQTPIAIATGALS